MKQYVSSEAVCPYYHKESPLTIYCDGIDGTASTAINFDGKDQKLYFCRHYCRSARGWRNCKLAAALTEERCENEQV